MAVISLQIGQCGNQTGHELFNTVYNDCYSPQLLPKLAVNQNFIQNSSETFFKNDSKSEILEARCIQVDMEEKVIRKTRSNSSCKNGWKYPSKACCSSKKGSGNNWALGFYLNGPACVSEVYENLRQEMEKCDNLDGIISTMSLAGGTGSGVGSYLLRCLRDTCPKVPLLAQLVWPYRHGEVSVQAYNAVLCLGHLLAQYDGAPDGFVIHENDVLHQTCLKRLGNSNQVTLSNMNSLMAYQLVGLLQPVSLPFVRRRLSRFLSNLCGPPDFKLYRLRCLPYYPVELKTFSTDTWPQLLRYGRQLILTGASVEDNIKWISLEAKLSDYRRLPVLACSAVIRGKEVAEVLNDASLFSNLTDGFLDQPICSLFQSPLMGDRRKCMGYTRSIFLGTSGGGYMTDSVSDESNLYSDPTAGLRLVTNRAWQLFTIKAYFHQYTKYGLELETFLDSISIIEQIIHSYKSMTL